MLFAVHPTGAFIFSTISYNSFNMSTPKLDDLEAVRTVVDTVKDFSPEDQQRILRWAIEKLGVSVSVGTGYTLSTHQTPSPSVAVAAPVGGKDIKTFMAEKKPRNDVQFAAAAAYYYRFEAPVSERKEAINQADLQEATRKAGRERFANPLKTLSNAHTLGMLDKGGEKGTYAINSVGENLVAMTLPDGGVVKKPAKKKAAKKKA